MRLREDIICSIVHNLCPNGNYFPFASTANHDGYDCK